MTMPRSLPVRRSRSSRRELPSKWVAHCHCSMCQRGSGAAFVTWVGAGRPRSRIIDPQRDCTGINPRRRPSAASAARCGTTMFFRSSRWPDELHVTLANFVDPVDRVPQAHVFWDTHVDWIRLDPADGLPRKTDRQ